MKKTKRLIALLLALAVIVGGSNLFRDHKLKASETNGDTTAQEQQDTAESAQTVVEIVVPAKEKDPEPAKEEVPAAEPVKEETPAAEPAKEEAPAAEPEKEETPTVEPVREEVLAVEPEQEEIPVVKPEQEEIPVVEPEQEEIPVDEPVQEEIPAVETKQEEIPEAEPAEADASEVSATEGITETENTEPSEVEETVAEETDGNPGEGLEEAEPETEAESRELIAVKAIYLDCDKLTAAPGEWVDVKVTIKVDNAEDVVLDNFILEIVKTNDGEQTEQIKMLSCSVLDGFVADGGELFELETGFVPFNGENEKAVLRVSVYDMDEEETRLATNLLIFNKAAEEELPEEPAIEPAEELPEQPSIEPAEELPEEPAIEPAEELPEQPSIEPAEELPDEPAIEPEEELPEEPAIEPAEELPEEPAIEPAEELPEEPAIEPAEELPEEPAIEPAEELPEEPAIEPAAESGEQNEVKPVHTPVPTPVPEVETVPAEEEEIEVPELDEMLLLGLIEYEDDANRYVELYVWYDGYTEGKYLELGQTLNITAVLYGFENDTDITYQWQVSSDNVNFTDIEKADKKVYSVVVTEENCNDFYRVTVLSEKMA